MWPRQARVAIVCAAAVARRRRDCTRTARTSGASFCISRRSLIRRSVAAFWFAIRAARTDAGEPRADNLAFRHTAAPTSTPAQQARRGRCALLAALLGPRTNSDAHNPTRARSSRCWCPPVARNDGGRRMREGKELRGRKAFLDFVFSGTPSFLLFFFPLLFFLSFPVGPTC